MSPETIKQIEQSLTPLADKLGQGAAQLYEIYVRQMVAEAIVYGIISLTILIVSLVLIFAGCFRAIRHGRKMRKEDNYSDWEPFVLGGWIGVGCISIVAIFSFIGTADAALKGMNPQYYALDRIVTQVAPKSE